MIIRRLLETPESGSTWRYLFKAIADDSNTFSLAICKAILCVSQLLSCLLTFQMCVGVISAASLYPRSHCREVGEPTAVCWFNWLCIIGLWCKYQEFLSKDCWTLSCARGLSFFPPPLFDTATKQGWYGSMQMSGGWESAQLMAVDVRTTKLASVFSTQSMPQ